MTDQLSQLNLDEDFQKVLSYPDAVRWKLEKSEPLAVLATLSPEQHTEELFHVRLAWTKYPDEPPSMKFRDIATGRLDIPAAWPVINGFRPPNLDACVNWCAEGFVLHPEWRNDPNLRWDQRGNVLLKVLRILQDKLDNNFEGRFKG